MDAQALRILIQRRLQSGQLPYDSASKVYGSPAAGEICAACGTVISNEQLVMEGVSSKRDGGQPIQFHVVCFEVWNDERRKPREPAVS
jgi:hypothetical protein